MLMKKSHDFWNQILLFNEKNKLPQCIDPFLGKETGVPEPMQERLSKVQSSGGYEFLLEATMNNKNTATNMSTMLKQCQAVIDQDQMIEDHYRSFYSHSWTLPNTKVAAGSNLATLNDYMLKYTQAGKTNQEMEQKQASNFEVLQLLSLSVA